MRVDFPRELLEETPDAIIAFTPDGEVLHWNRAAEVMFGFTRGQAVGHLLVELFVPPDRVEEEPRIQRDARERAVAVYESVRRRKGGSPVCVSASTKAIRESDNGDLRAYD